MENYVQPALVFRVKEFYKDKKTYTYFLATLKTDNLYSLEDYTFMPDSQ